MRSNLPQKETWYIEDISALEVIFYLFHPEKLKHMEDLFA